MFTSPGHGSLRAVVVVRPSVLLQWRSVSMAELHHVSPAFKHLHQSSNVVIVSTGQNHIDLASLEKEFIVFN